MDANYVMDETLGNSSFDITKLRIGQKKTESFLIGKVWDGENIWIMKLYVPLKTRVFQTVCLNSGKVVRHYICMWPVMILYIFPTGNQSVLGDVAGDLVCLWGFTWVGFKNIFFPFEMKSVILFFWTFAWGFGMPKKIIVNDATWSCN